MATTQTKTEEATKTQTTTVTVQTVGARLRRKRTKAENTAWLHTRRAVKEANREGGTDEVVTSQKMLASYLTSPPKPPASPPKPLQRDSGRTVVVTRW